MYYKQKGGCYVSDTQEKVNYYYKWSNAIPMIAFPHVWTTCTCTCVNCVYIYIYIELYIYKYVW